MLTFNTCKIFIVSISLVFLLYGCGATHSDTSSRREKSDLPQSQEMEQKPLPGTSTSKQAEQKVDESSQTTSRVSIFGRKKPAESSKLKVKYSDINFVQLRLNAYENKFEHWLKISEKYNEGTLATKLAAYETECVQNLERILTGYSLLLDRMQQSETVSVDRIATVDPKEMQQLDIAFLESRCSELLSLDIADQYEFMPETEPEITFDVAQEAIASHMEQGNYLEVLYAYERLSLAFPDQKPSLSTQLNYGLTLQYTGQTEAAARHFKGMLESGELSIEPLSLQREIADLFLASGNVAAAESYYESIILAHESIGVEKSWAEEQLAFLRSVDSESDEMAAYIKLLREFHMYDYRIYSTELNEAINAFATEYAGSPVAVSGLRLKTFAADQLKLWFGRQLVHIDSLVADKKFTEATEMLKRMSRYYLPAELQAVLQKTFYEVSQAEIREIETQRHIQEMELTEQWDTAVNLLDSQQYDNAILAFEALVGTEYEERAKMKIVETANQAASQMRKEAASLFIKAGRTPDFEKKKELLLASHRLLTEILDKYPQTDLLDKVNQNKVILEEQIMKIDPALLEVLREENAEEQPDDSSGPFSRKLQ
ncbi:MAG: hypothetical protein JSW69_08300 [Deltaproteobacteria bacterium]|nr:MAG: hypothetical protein JSW69_08300 [Deltaproteobacteria bacterium]